MQENIKKILDTMRGQPEGQAIQVFVEEKIQELSYLGGISGSIEEKGRVVEARQEAIKILKNLFNFLEVKQVENKRTKYN